MAPDDDQEPPGGPAALDPSDVLAALLRAAQGLPAQGWATVRRERDGSVSVLLKVGCRSWRARGPKRHG